MSEAAAAREYTQREIEAMETQDLLRLYKETGNEELKWPLVLRYEGRHHQRGHPDAAVGH